MGIKKFPSLHTWKQIFITNWFNTRYLIGHIFFHLILLMILYTNKLSISLDSQYCEIWSQITDINFTKSPKISCHTLPHNTNSCYIPNLISKQVFQIKTLKYIFPFIIQQKPLLMVSHDRPQNLQMSNLDLTVLSTVRIKQICISFEDLVNISMISLILIGPK